MEQTLNKDEQKQWVIVPCEFILLQVLNNKTLCETANENPPVENLPVQKTNDPTLSLPNTGIDWNSLSCSLDAVHWVCHC